MKKFLLVVIFAFILIGCGGGGGGEDTPPPAHFSDAVSGTSYDASEYVLPSSTPPSGSSVSTRSYHATIRETQPDTYEEIPSNTTDEKILYHKKSNGNILISLYKNDTEVYSYEMKGKLIIGEQSTVQPSACIVANHFESIYLNNENHSDVVEIDCGKRKGYYQKGKGFIAQE